MVYDLCSVKYVVKCVGLTLGPRIFA